MPKGMALSQEIGECAGRSRSTKSMKKETILKFFPKCNISETKTNQLEIREGWYSFMGKKWLIKGGIISAPKFSKTVIAEQKAVSIIDEIPELGGGKVVNDKKYIDLLKLLPRSGKDKIYYQPGAILNISLGESDYFKKLQKIKPHQNILEIGADTGWSCHQLVKSGHRVLGIDINHHLQLRDLWLKNKVYFEMAQVDMNDMPFKDGAFDVVFASASVHHSPEIKKTAKEFFRVLKPGGKFIFLREPMSGDRFKKKEFAKEQNEMGISENLYSKKEWIEAFQNAGFLDIKTELSNLDYGKVIKHTSGKMKIIYILKNMKKKILKTIPHFQNHTISDFNITGKRSK